MYKKHLFYSYKVSKHDLIEFLWKYPLSTLKVYQTLIKMGNTSVEMTAYNGKHIRFYLA